MLVNIDGLAPKKAHPTDAAFDVYNAENVVCHIAPGECELISCGFAIAIPEGHVGLICSRSGLAIRDRLFVLNAPGVIDPGYRGEVKVILANFSPNFRQVAPGERIAQLLIIPTTHVTLVQNKNALGEATDRGDNGFGSTGQ